MNQFGNIIKSLPSVTKNLIIINFIVWLAMMVMGRHDNSVFMRLFSLHYIEAPDFNPAQLFTYMFMHSTTQFSHLFFNMFTLFMFGVVLERMFGAKRFLFFYISCGFGAALIQEGVWAFTLPAMIEKDLAILNHTSVETIGQYLAANPDIMANNLNIFTTVGASGAIYGTLLAFGMIFPNRPMYFLFIPVPIKAKWMITGFVVIELLMGLSVSTDGVAHFAHLGGMLIAFFIILYWKKKGIIHGGYY
ncbi:MAG: rhomboid family intramembrane serine protease [Firmicutes bacterium]|nr:rhomboid family intramembrane serine protease [Bacillota bacterium]MCM1400998.1 rhomboid family intramembrane serine protease [Bacteroides sp.]MCM1476525.1 rhomboid family intramembrane serine protease [Bacteroides sp.]